MNEQGPILPGQEGLPVEAMPVEAPRRAASLTLRADDIRTSRAASLEAANKSLADALRWVYFILQLVMVGMVILFVFSGFQRIEQSERGVKVSLGKLADSDLQPGFQLSLPYPLGEIIKVPTSQLQLNLAESFFPFLSNDDRAKTIEQLGFGDILRPGKDGSLITGDGNLAHARFGVTFHTESPADFVQNVGKDQEGRLVKAVIERAAVQTFAEIKLDDILKRASSTGTQEGAQASAGSEIEERVRRIAQKSLDDLKTGLRIDTVSLRDETPPLRTRQSYQAVQTAESTSATQRQNAEKQRSEILNQAAGSAYPVVLALIDDYGRALDAKDQAGADKALATLSQLLESSTTGMNITAGGQTFKDVRMSGLASRVVEDAKRYRSNVVQRAKGQAQTFEAKREQYRANPSVFITREWADAMTAFLKQDRVQAKIIPDHTQKYTLRVSEDPDILRGQRQALQEEAVRNNPALRRGLESGTMPGDSK